ncbi:MAG TPA: phosphopantetheine-binding protein [Burkholderiaceae bacterium]|nr:phosphopantetheine-binding protein [Burkholderiaceae bacterium]
MDVATGSSLAASGADPRIATILDIVARETKIDRDRLQLDARTDDLGIGSLDLTLVVFEIESHFGIELLFAPEPPTEKSMTVGMLIDHVLQALDARAPTAASR